MQIAGIVMRMTSVIKWLNDNEDLPESMLGFVLAWLLGIAGYCNAAIRILNNPSVVHPVAGRRCIFY